MRYLRWLLLGLCFATPALGYWQSRSQVSVGGASYEGPGDALAGAIVWWGLQPITAAYSGNIVKLCDAATGIVCATATAAAGVVTYPTISGSPCDNTSNICIVDTLYDQIGNACASSTHCNMISTTVNRPTFIAAGAANGCPNTALPCMSTNGTSQCMWSQNNFTLSQPFTSVAVAMRPDNTLAGKAIIGNFDASNGVMRDGSSANTINIVAGGSAFSATSSDGSWHSIQGVFNGASPNSIIGVDGSTTTGTVAAGGWSAETIGFMGNDSFCSNGDWNGKAVEGGIWNSALTAGNLGTLSTNAHSAGRWNF